MHVALVHRDLHQITRGGICTVYRCLARDLARRGHQVTLLTQATPHPVAVAGVDVLTLPRTEDLDAHRARVATALDQISPDVAECSTWDAELLTYAARPPERRAPVLVRGDLPAATMRATGLAAAERAICHAADELIAVSNYAAGALHDAYGLTRPGVVANGVDRQRFHPDGATLPGSGWRVQLDHDGSVTARQPLAHVFSGDPGWADFFRGERASDSLVRLVWVGKFTEMKGFDRLTRIIPRLAGRARLLIILGHGQVHYPVPELDTDGHVLICQDLDDADLPAVYRTADYLLSTSRWEGYGFAIAEALACGTPALLPADLGVAPELITLETGAIWHTETELLHLLDVQPTLRGSLPARYSWAANTESTLGIYERLLGARVDP